jgi:hypothetical protein
MKSNHEKYNYDLNGRPILIGDTLKIYHFTDNRKKKHFMYKWVLKKEIIQGNLFYLISHLSHKDRNPYNMLVDGQIYPEIEIVQGFDECGIPFEERTSCAPRQESANNAQQPQAGTV